MICQYSEFKIKLWLYLSSPRQSHLSTRPLPAVTLRLVSAATPWTRERGPPGGEYRWSTTYSGMETTPQGQVGLRLWKMKRWHDYIINLYKIKLKWETDKVNWFFCRIFPAVSFPVPPLWLHQPSDRSSFTREPEVLPEILLFPEGWAVYCINVFDGGLRATVMGTRFGLTAGFNQTHSALMVYLQQQQGGSQEKIWTQGERSKGIWIAADVTFQTSRPAKVRIRKKKKKISKNMKRERKSFYCVIPQNVFLSSN